MPRERLQSVVIGSSLCKYVKLCLSFVNRQKIALIKVSSDLEMSDLSSKILVDENSGCESESESERREKINKFNKNRKRKKERDSDMKNQQDTDDETESQQLNFEETQINSSTPFSSPVYTIYNQDRMRRRLQFHFMNPIEKWQAKRR